MGINTNMVDSIIAGLGSMPKKSEIDTITNNIDKVVDEDNDGLMSVADKAELDRVSKILKNIDSDDPVFYDHPTTAGNKHIPAGGSSGQILKWNANGTAKWEKEKTYDVVDTKNDGLMSIADKANLDAAVTKLNGIANGANKYTLPTASKDKLGGVKTTSDVTSIEGLNPCPIIEGVPYYKDTFNEYDLPTASSTTLGGVTTTSSVTSTTGLTACPIIAGVPYYKGITIDSETSTTSTNPLQNKIITSTFALKSKYGNSTINVGRKAGTVVGSWSTAEGYETTAGGRASHSEGYYTTASGDYSHAEGNSVNTVSSIITDFSSETTNDTIITAWKTTKFSLAKGKSSHVEGETCLALGNYSHAEGSQTIANGGYSHAEGQLTTASGAASHVEGCETTASGILSHAEGAKTTASGNYSHTEGRSDNEFSSIITDFSSETTNDDIITAWETTNFSLAKGEASHVEGYDCLALGNSSHAEGVRTTASGDSSHAEGRYTTATGYACHAEGFNTIASDYYSHAEGNIATATGYTSHAEGYKTVASGDYSHAEGFYTSASGSESHAEGSYTTADNNYSHSGGKYNVALTTGTAINTTNGTAFVIGNGTSETSLSNAFSIQFNGTVKAKSTITASTTADYAEFFEWLDSNPDNEDRVGYFVTLDGDKIRIATDNDDYILGVVSGEPFVLGNGDCDTWNGMYLHDEFRRTIYEPAPKIEEVFDDDNKPTGKYKEVPGEYEGTRPKLNPNYDHTKPYISRFDRKEWSPVGMLGVLAVRHDGTAKVNGYVTVNKDGIATSCSKSTENSYRVIKSNSDLVVEIIFR